MAVLYQDYWLCVLAGWRFVSSRDRRLPFYYDASLNYALCCVFPVMKWALGGNNGLTDFKEILGFNLQATAHVLLCLLITRDFTAVIFVVSQKILSLGLGKVVLAILDFGILARALLAIEPDRYKVWLFVYSAVIAGMLCALLRYRKLALFNPARISPINSIEMVILGRSGWSWHP